MKKCLKKTVSIVDTMINSEANISDIILEKIEKFTQTI